MLESFFNMAKLILALITVTILLGACTTFQPILYPNEHTKKVGDEQVRRDINECMRIAKKSDTKFDDVEEVAKETASGASRGAATGAATGVLAGNVITRAAMGAVRGVFFAFIPVTTITQRSKEPSHSFKQIVENCLIQKGYEPFGWQK